MAGDVRLFKIDPSEKKANAVSEIDFAEAGFRETRDIQEWIADNPTILGEDLLIIAKEFSGFDKTNERADLVAVDRDGKIGVIELKRDDTGADVHWQAIKYASYFQNTKADGIVRMLGEFKKISEPEAIAELQLFLDDDDLERVNNDQRIILASHRFAPEVTSVVIWLNEKTSPVSMITCIQLTPYRNQATNSYFIQSSTILPITGTDEFTMRAGESRPRSVRSFGKGPVKKEDDMTRLLRGAASDAVNSLPNELRPDKRSQWAGVGGDHRYFHVWYRSEPWSNWGMSYQIMLFPKTDSEKTRVITSFKCMKDRLISREGFSQEDITQLKITLEKQSVFPEQEITDDNRWLELKETSEGDAETPEFKRLISSKLQSLVEVITPAIEVFVNERNEQ